MESVKLAQSEKLRSKLEVKAKASLYFFCKAILGYKDLTLGLHMKLCKFLEESSLDTFENGTPLKWDKLVELPRGHLKSSICTIGYPMWRAIHNPNIRILISNATATNASHFLRTIMGHFESNELFRWVFPDLIPEKGKTKWTSTELEINRTKIWPEATFESIGVGGTAVSRHYDLQIEDDLVAAEHLESEQMGKIIEWHQYALSLSVSPASLQKIVVGTRWAYNDLISFILKHEPHYKQFRRSATDTRTLAEDAKPIWPERFTLTVLREIENTQGRKIFAAQYMNHPTFEDPNAFNINIIRKFNALPEGDWTYYTAIDPALSEKRGDYSAIVTVGRNHLNEMFCVDARMGRWSVDLLIENIFDVNTTFKPRQIGLETVLFQKVLLYPIREAMRRQDIRLPLIELRPSSGIIKTARIATLGPYFSNGSLWIREDMDHVFQQLLEFPVGAHDDVIDALAYAVQMTRVQQKKVVPSDTNPLLLENILGELDIKHKGEVKGWSKHLGQTRVSLN